MIHYWQRIKLLFRIKARTMLTRKERREETSKLTLEQRKEILEKYFQDVGYDPKHLTEIQKDDLTGYLWGLGYHASMFDFAFRVLLSSQRVKR